MHGAQPCERVTQRGDIVTQKSVIQRIARGLEWAGRVIATRDRAEEERERQCERKRCEKPPRLGLRMLVYRDLELLLAAKRWGAWQPAQSGL